LTGTLVSVCLHVRPEQGLETHVCTEQDNGENGRRLLVALGGGR
jgi:hypothetical protein